MGAYQLYLCLLYTSVIGANVIVKGTTIGNITDVNGTFTVENVPDDAVLQISYICLLYTS